MKSPLKPFLREDCGFTLDLGQSGLAATALEGLREASAAAHAEMCAIEAGVVKNLDEYRQVTHFTDRRAYLGSADFEAVERFFADVAAGRVGAPGGQPFAAVVINGIGGSALGPQFLQFAVNGPYWNELSTEQRRGFLKVYFLDNTDSAGFADLAAVIDPARTLAVTISKSGGTRETANNLVALEALYAEHGVPFAPCAAAITMAGSKLDQKAREDNWLQVWPMAESIGGRTSETAVVGHVPAAAAGIDFRALLEGALVMDEWTRQPELPDNPAYLLAASWYLLGQGRGDKNMVIVPYSDRLVLLSRYLQQLVMESLGKDRDRDGALVHQGLTVYGNKGGTDAHAFIQQLNDGRNDFFITFIEVLADARQLDADGQLTMGDYLHNFQQGLSNALAGRQRSVVTIRIDQLSPRSIGMLIALYERAVAVYAEMININAFHQPGVEAYKLISGRVNKLAVKLQGVVADNAGWEGTAADAAALADLAGLERDVEGILAKYAANQRRFGGQRVERSLADGTWRFRFTSA